MTDHKEIIQSSQETHM